MSTAPARHPSNLGVLGLEDPATDLAADPNLDDLPAAFAAFARLSLRGIFIPHVWFHRLLTAAGRPDSPALIVLADLVYWHRPIIRTDADGRKVWRKRFAGDLFQCNAAYYERKFHLSKTQARRALIRLETAGLIRRELRTIVRNGVRYNNVVFVELNIEGILALSRPLSPEDETLSPPSHTTQISTQNSQDPTTPNPSSRRVLRRRGGEQSTESPSPEVVMTVATQEIAPDDFFPLCATDEDENPDLNRTESQKEGENAQAVDTVETAKITEAVDTEAVMENAEVIEAVEVTETTQAVDTAEVMENAEVIEAVEDVGPPSELVYPPKLTARELGDMAAQVRSLPREVAQQVLDVVASFVQRGRVRTNAAALLRGVVRRYRAGPEQFDPSSGWQVAEARRRRAESEAQRRAAETFPPQETALLRAPPPPRERSLEVIAAQQAAMATIRQLLRRPRGAAG